MPSGRLSSPMMLRKGARICDDVFARHLSVVPCGLAALSIGPWDPHVIHAAPSRAIASTSAAAYETIKVVVEACAGKITISRPKALNAVSSKVRHVRLSKVHTQLCTCEGVAYMVLQTMDEIVSAARALDQDPQVKALIITGEGSKAFAAGADIKEMASQEYSEVHLLKDSFVDVKGDRSRDVEVHQHGASLSACKHAPAICCMQRHVATLPCTGFQQALHGGLVRPGSSAQAHHRSGERLRSGGRLRGGHDG